MTTVDSNKLYFAVVNKRVEKIKWEVVEEFRKLGFKIMASSGFLHEETINMALIINQITDDEKARAAIRPIVRKWVMPN